MGRANEAAFRTALKRWTKMHDNMQEIIDRQRHAIDRLVRSSAVLHTVVYDLVNVEGIDIEDIRGRGRVALAEIEKMMPSTSGNGEDKED